jgi:hypothetical protein
MFDDAIGNGVLSTPIRNSDRSAKALLIFRDEDVVPHDGGDRS